MAQLTTLDTALLRAPTSDEHASLAVGAVAIIDGTIPDFDLLENLLAQRIQPIDPARFDLIKHIQRVALPQPGDDSELFQLIAQALERPLDLERPLWECWIIEGLRDDRWAILIKVHHSVADSMSPVQLLTRLCDDVDADTFANDVAVEPISPDTGPLGWMDTAFRAYANAVKVATRALTWPAIWLSPAESLVTMRRYRTVRVPRTAVDAVSRKFGVNANDVALAVITEGFRSVLLRSGEQPRVDSLRTLARADERISALLPYLPVDEEDPVAQLRAVHGRLNKNAAHQPGKPGSGVELTPLALCSKVIQTLTRLPQHVVTLATNAPGPRQRLRLMGQRIDQLLPIPPTALQLSTGVAVLSYGDELVFGITAEYQAAPDMAQLAAGIELGMARLVALSEDSVLLFSKDRRKRPTRSFPGSPQRKRPTTPTARVRR